MSIARSLSSVASVVVLGFALTSCSAHPEEAAPDPPAVVEDIPGSEVKSVALRADAAEAIGLKTAAVAKATATGRVTIPYAAVVYYLDGTTWTYTETGDHTFQRAPITVAGIAGDVATLTAGPAVGTPVVVVGAPEVLGAELEIDGEE
jgi:hypothetical protein